MEALTAAIDELVDTDPLCLSDGEAIRELHRQLDRLEAVTARAVDSFVESGDWRADGARSAVQWLSATLRYPKWAARSRAALGKSVRGLPRLAEAWLAGDVSAHQARLVSRLRNPRTSEQLDRDEELLVDKAKELQYRHFFQACEYWMQLADPDGVEEAARKQRDKRRFSFSKSWEDGWFADGLFDALSGEVISGELKRLYDRLFEQDKAAARERLGREPHLDELGRTAPQRRADALFEMAVRSRMADDGGRRPEPLFTVLVGYETFAGRICELANGTVVSPGSVVPYLGESWVERVVFGSPSRVMDVGERRRPFTGALRRAIQVRDRECFHPFCDVSAEDAEVDHYEPYAAGGATTQENGRVGCKHHNIDRDPVARTIRRRRRRSKHHKPPDQGPGQHDRAP